MNDLSSFHDAYLVGAHVLNQTGKVLLEIVDGESHVSLSLAGVKAFRLVDMQTQNVIYRLEKHSGASVDDDKVKETLKWISSSVDSKPYMTEEAISRYVRDIKSGALALVVLEPSVGAELAVLCELVTKSA